MLSYSTIFIIFLLNTFVSAFTSFDTNCTLPADNERVNYVSSPNTRGTLSIIWSCLFTIIACTWTVQHPDVPWQRKHYHDGKRGWWKWKWNNVKHSTAWFLGTIIAPEIPLAKHLGDLWEAQKLANEFNKYKSEGDVVWTQSHWLFAIMGGFVMRTNVPKEKILHRAGLSSQPETEKAGASSPPSENSQSRGKSPAPNGDTIVAEPGLSENDIEKPSLVTMPGVSIATLSDAMEYPRILNPQEILVLVKSRILPQLPDIDIVEIEDKSKSDNLMRLIAVFQILWLCIQVIARAVGDLAVSQLEIATVAFALCAVIMYGLAWNKPKGVQTPITILQVPDDGRGVGSCLQEERTPGGKSASAADMFYEVPKIERWIEHLNHYLKMDHAGEEDEFLTLWVLGGVFLTGTLFGGVHVAAWNSYFPTHAELILWRVAALYCTCVPVGIYLIFFILARLDSIYGRNKTASTRSFKRVLSLIVEKLLGILFMLLLLVLVLSFPVYVLARLYILVEIFRTMAFQPTGAFIGTWAVNMPNVN